MSKCKQGPYQLPADVVELVLWVAQGDLRVGQLLVKVVDGLFVGRHLAYSIIIQCNVLEPRVMVLILRSIENVEWWCYLLICTPFSSSILFLTLWSALMQAPANSKVAWMQWIEDAISTIRDRKYIINHNSKVAWTQQSARWQVDTITITVEFAKYITCHM